MIHSVDIKRLITKFKLPENAKFLGYSIWSLHSEMFLAFYENDNDIEDTIWLTEPELPYIFGTRQHAESFAKHYGKGVSVVLLFDLGDTYWFELV